MKTTVRILILSTLSAVLLAALAVAQEKKEAHFSIVSATYRPGVLVVVVKNEGDQPGVATVSVHRERSRCVEEDADYCRQNPPAAGETCVPPCLRYETSDLGTETGKSDMVASCREATVSVAVPAEEAYAEITVKPGSGLAFGAEIRPEK